MYNEQHDMDTDEINKDDLLQFYDNFVSQEHDFSQLDDKNDKYNEFYMSSETDNDKENDRWAFVKNRCQCCVRYKNMIYNSANFVAAKFQNICKDSNLLKTFDKEVL